MFAFPSKEWQPSSLPTMPFEWGATTLYSRQTLSPEEALQLPSKHAKSEGSSKKKRTKTATSSGSSQPKSVASSVSAVGRPSSHGSGHRRSRSPERKRRHGGDKRQDSPRHQSSRREGHSSGRREGEWSRRFQLPETCRVRQCLQGVGHPSVGLFLSSSSSFLWRS